MAEPATQYEEELPEEEEEPEQPLPVAANDNRQQAAPQNKKGIGTLVALALITVALGFDALQFFASLLHVAGPPLGLLTGGAAGALAGAIVGGLTFLLVTGLTWNPVAGGAAGVAAGVATTGAVTVAVSIMGIATASVLAMIVPFWVGIFSQIVFLVWFALLGRSYNRNFATRLLIHMSMFVTELVPLINALPGITLGVVALILLSRAEAMFGPDIKGIPLSKLGTLFRNQLPLVRTAVKMSNPLREVPTDPDAPSRQWGPQGNYKEAVLEEAMVGTDRKLFDVERRYYRRYGTGSAGFREAVRQKDQERNG